MIKASAMAHGKVPTPGLADYRARIADEFVYQRPLTPVLGKPLVSIITQTLNAAATVKQTIESVRGQTYSNIEHIIVDGLSRDSTMDLVMAAQDGLGAVVQGKDASPADAANKGVAAARGDYITVLPSDDYVDPSYVEECLRAITESGADYVFGDLVYMEKGRPPILVPGDPNYARHILTAMPDMAAITIMYRRECFEKIGLWDLGNPYCPDYDWLLRAHIAGLKGGYNSSIRGYFRHGGVSSTNYLASLAWTRAVAIKHGAQPLRAWKTYWGGVFRKRVRDLLRAWLPAPIFYALLRKLTRSGSYPIEVNVLFKEVP